MKQTRSLQSLAAEVQRQADSKKDFLVHTPKIKVYSHDNAIEMGFALKDESPSEDDHFTGGLTKNGHEQLGAWAGIPKTYYDRMNTGADTKLLAHNLQYWLDKGSDRRMIRVLDGKVRAMLSDRYRRLDNHDLLMAVLPMLLEASADIVGCEITDDKMYIKALVHSTRREVAELGDVMEAGVIISNSEVSKGSLSIRPLLHKLSCMNGMVINELATKKYHVGKKANEFAEIVFSDEANEAEDKAFWLKTRDTLKHSLSDVTFDKIIKSLIPSTKMEIKDPKVAIELVTKKFGFTQDEGDGLLNHLIKGGDMTSWGLANAVTRQAQDVESYDRSVEMEGFGHLVAMNKWN